MERIAAHHQQNAVVLTRRCPGDEEFDRAQAYKVKRIPRFDWSHKNRVVNILLRTCSLGVRLFINLIFLGELIRTEDIDVVYCAYPISNGLPMMIVRWLTGCPYVVFCHGTEVLRDIHRGGVRKRLLRLVLRSALKVVVTGEFMANVVSQLMDRANVVISPLGGDSKDLDPKTPPIEQLGEVDLMGRQVILTVGRVVMRKGHDMVAKALPLIRQECPQALWIIVGDGPDLPTVREIISRENQLSHTIFAGRLSYRDLSGLYARADCFLMPNRQIGYDVEGFGIVFLEAAIFGTPSVGGDSGGAPQAISVGETGLLCDGEDPADIADKVNTILKDDKLRQKMSANGPAWVAKHTWENWAVTVANAVAPLIE